MRIPANWKTTLAGAGGAGITAAIEYLTTGGLSGKGAAVAFGLAALGWFSKDAGVSGTAK